MMRGVGVLALCLAATAKSVVGQSALAQIRVELDKTEQSLRDKPISDPQFPQFARTSAGLISGARASLANGAVFLSLERLGQVWSVVLGTRSAVERTAKADSKSATFESEWSAADQRISAVEHETHDRLPKRAPAAQRALVETARGRIAPLMSASRAFGNSDAGILSAFLYLGQAEAQAEFVRFCSSLHLEASQSRASRSVLPELHMLQTRVNGAFVSPRSIEKHPQFIALNALLKHGYELDSVRAYSGSMYRYLDATQSFGVMDAIEVDTVRKNKVKQQLASAQAEINASKRDDSIEELFLERAQAAIAKGDDASSDEWRTAESIANNVFTAYSAALRSTSVIKRGSGRSIVLTLVRWPFT